MSSRHARRSLLLAVLLAAGARLAGAEPPEVSADPLAPVRSMGQPPRWKPFAGGFYGLDRSGDTDHDGGGATLGVYKDLLPSIVGVGLSAEGYLAGYTGLSGVDG